MLRISSRSIFNWMFREKAKKRIDIHLNSWLFILWIFFTKNIYFKAQHYYYLFYEWSSFLIIESLKILFGIELKYIKFNGHGTLLCFYRTLLKMKEKWRKMYEFQCKTDRNECQLRIVLKQTPTHILLNSCPNYVVLFFFILYYFYYIQKIQMNDFAAHVRTDTKTQDDDGQAFMIKVI